MEVLFVKTGCWCLLEQYLDLWLMAVGPMMCLEVSVQSDIIPVCLHTDCILEQWKSYLVRSVSSNLFNLYSTSSYLSVLLSVICCSHGTKVASDAGSVEWLST